MNHKISMVRVRTLKYLLEGCVFALLAARPAIIKPQQVLNNSDINLEPLQFKCLRFSDIALKADMDIFEFCIEFIDIAA